MKTQYEELDVFVATSLLAPYTRNSHFKFGSLTVFMRVATHNIEGSLARTLDIASVDLQSNQQGRGLFSSFLNHVERLALKSNLVVFVESIMNENLEEALRKRGYVVQGDEECPNAFFTLKQLDLKYPPLDESPTP